MKIVKVVHGARIEDIEAERQLVTLQDYDIEDFIKRHGNTITSETRVEAQRTLRKTLLRQMWLALVKAAEKLVVLPWDYEDLRVAQAVLEVSRTHTMKRTIDILISELQSQSQLVEVLSLGEAKIRYPKTSNLSVGTYTYHPYDSMILARLEYYHRNLALEKDDELVVLLGKMGAKTLRIEERDVEQMSTRGSASIETIEAGAGGGVSLERKLDKEKELLVTFQGNVVDIDPDLLDDSLWFSRDSRLRAIFESRRFNPNKIENYTLRSTYTETFDFDFNLAARYLVVKVDLKAEYEALSKKERLFHVEFGR